MIIAIVVIAIIMIPIALMLMEYVRAIAYADSLTVAANLAQREIGIINNVDYDVLNSAVFTNYAGYNFDLDRAVTHPVSGAGPNNDLKMVRLRIYPHPMAAFAPLIDLVTYVIGMNIGFGTGSTGGALGDESASLSVSGGTLNRNNLNNVTLQNTRSNGNITMTGVIISSTQDKTLNSITIYGDNRISASTSITSSPTSVSFTKNFFMNSSTSYTGSNGASFNFANAPNQSYALTIIFVFYDGTQSVPYIWTYTK